MNQNNKPTETANKYDLEGCSYLDQSLFKRKISAFRKLSAEQKIKASAEIEERIKESKLALEAKLRRTIAITYPDSLPVAQQQSEILDAIKSNQVVVVAGETGSGKTTQLPKICLEAGLGRKGLIGHTQPRRLAARTVSARIAEELNTELGAIVGYQVRFTDKVSDDTMVKVMTDGILLSEIKRDKYLHRYDAIIIDEAHERSLNIDFLLGYLKQLLPKRPELKIIITSATIDVDRFSKHFSEAPVISVSGRSYPVDIEYWFDEAADTDDLSLPELVEQVLHEIPKEEKKRAWQMGDVLVFLPGEREIREVSQHLRHSDFRDTEIVPLYARLSNAEQSKIFQSHAGRRVVLSTNVAETSITVPGIRYVIDSGLVRMSRYSYRSKIQRLPIERVSQASANQRAGRCGRVAEGICFRLYSESDFISRQEFTEPEILRTNLASVILKMKDSGLGDVYQFPFVDLPDKRLWNDGFKLLFELGAVDAKQQLTGTGRKLAYFPTDPRLAKVLIESQHQGCFEEALIIVSALSIQDPRERPAEKRQAADQAHAQFKDEESDFVSYLNIWNAYEAQRQELSNSQLKRYCQKAFLSPMRMREWRDLHRQLLLLSKESGGAKKDKTKGVAKSSQVSGHKAVQELNAMKEHKLDSGRDGRANYDRLHKALLSGFIGQIGSHDEKREYRGCRNRRFQVFPGSVLARKKAKWLVSAEIVETQQVYARTNAKIEVEWIEPIASHLVKKSWSEPHWQKKKGQVTAFEKVTLYGLDIVARRAVNFGSIDPVVSREIFIRSGVIEGEYASKSDEIKANRKLISDLEALEDRTRRRDIVVDEEVIYALYDAVIPDHIVSAASFEKWHRSADQATLAKLRFERDQLCQSEADTFDPALFPDTLENNGIRFPLSYHFDPTSDQDGVTISVPVTAARQVTAAKLEKKVPGLLKEKCIQLVKNLPRTLRKNFVPVPDVIESIFERVERSDAPLLEALSSELKYKSGVEVPLHAWNPELIDKHLRFNIEIVDDSGKVIEEGRDLLSVVEKVEHLVDKQPLQTSSQRAVTQSTDWDFGELPEFELIKQAGVQMKMFPALKDCGKHVEKVAVADQASASRLSRLGLARLLMLRLGYQLEEFSKVMPHYRDMALLYAPVGQAKALYDDFAMMCVVAHFNTSEVCRTRTEFDERFESGRADFLDSSKARAELVYDILRKYHALMKSLKGKVNLALALPMADLQAQVEQLVSGRFLIETSFDRLQHFPRYLEACSVRLEKMPREMAKERQYVPILKNWWQQYHDKRQQFDRQGIWDEDLEHFRWLIEEQRVSWYAQQLKTAETVSEKRLNRHWSEIRRV